MDRDSRPVDAEPVLAGGVTLNEGNGTESGLFKSKVKSSNSSKQ